MNYLSSVHLSSEEVFFAHRLPFCIVLVTVLHIIIIFGINWHNKQSTSNNVSRTVQVILAQNPSYFIPKNANNIAPLHQQANGIVQQETIEAAVPFTWQPQLFRQYEKLKNTEIVTSTSANEKVAKEKLQEQANDANLIQTEEIPLQNEITQLRAEFAKQQQNYEKSLKTKTVSAAAMAAEDAAYLHEWQNKVENIGNLHYPEKAKEYQLKGNVLLLVAINADGSLNKVQIRQSSGNKILDDAAIDIVKLAQPFSPLPAEIRQKTQILEIIRTWQFGFYSNTIQIK